ncbi:MAG TPA: tetratricopeptide repeat protein [Vicinamibacterales bacterium]|nr:tetratricopeptide repeat protein [Vicinamibacterales bacterium]
MRAAALLLTLALAGCALHAPAVSLAAAPDPTPSRAGDIDRLVERGCYRCLEQAHEAAAAASDAVRTFETALLLAARSKELGLPFAPWMEKARAAAPPGPDWSDYLAIVDALRIDPLADDRDVTLLDTLKNRASADKVAGWRTDLATGAGSPLLRTYLELSLICQYIVEDRNVTIAAAVQRFHDVPLVEYRAGACGPGQAPHLAAVREAVPDFADVDFALGRYAMDIPQQPDQDEALRRFTAAHAAFPASPAIIANLAAVRRDREEWVDALEAYDATLALVATHRDALLGRMVTLSHLARYEDAIATAAHILDLGSWFTGEAYYWRAWNEYHLARIDEARADTDKAKGLMHNAAVLVLSGMIEWHEHRLDESEAELQDALTLDAGECEAAFLLGSVRAERRQWTSGAAAFELAQRCYDLSVTLRRETIARITAGPGSEEGKARLIARQQRAMTEEAQHRDEAAQNAAQLQKRGGV